MKSVLHQRIMRRVYAAWALKKIFSPVSMKAVILLILVKRAADAVFVKMVLQNAPSPANVAGTFDFYLSAYSHTEFLMKILSLAIIFVAAWLSFDFLQSVRTPTLRYR